MNYEARLCYIDGDNAFFTTQPLSDQWGDDWDDAPYEHNAGDPYTFGEHYARMGREPWEIVLIKFEGDFRKPCDVALNSPYSVKSINAGAIAWLAPNEWSDHKVKVTAGATMREFIDAVQEAGGTVYVPLAKVSVEQLR